MIPVQRHSSTAAWAQFRNGRYEFEIDDNLQGGIDDGIEVPEFEMDEGRPVAIRFRDTQEREGLGLGME